ncbi:hypothetical protein LOY54_17555 [Pseudomonas sp. B21-032]|uniref:hypothetical protein n=1 Tax=Pseudomonas sp. B21-032 TaxID=2895483 RepID=UPI00215F202C|nr:hypothetical protein [Pseudomonas sp. B21-032]UVL59845.1 hypothetical protein LOY54_17555 [Pseudomonas sp. B21-032]
MTKDPFAPSISVCQHASTILALLVAWLMGFTGWSALLFILIVAGGGALEGAVLALRKTGYRG